MIETITYCKDTKALIAELKEKYPDFVYEGKFGIDKTPVVKNGSETMSLVMIDEDMLNSLISLENLGTFEEVFADSKKKAIYDRIYPREFKYKDLDGNEQTGLKPERFGGFAK
jgi:hypothetical protein